VNIDSDLRGTRVRRGAKEAAGKANRPNDLLQPSLHALAIPADAPG
jgi:hypothetical protein